MGWREDMIMGLIALHIAILFGLLNISNKLDDIVRQLEKLNERGNDGSKEESNPYIR